MDAGIPITINPNPSILLFSSRQDALEALQKSIHLTWEEQNKDLRQNQSCNIHIARSVEPFLNYQKTDNKLQIDFVVFLIDPRIVTSLNETEASVKRLQHLFGRQQILLVALDLDYSCAVSPVQLRAFSKVYQFGLLIGSVNKKENRRHLSQQILNLCEITTGKCNGIPAVRKC